MSSWRTSKNILDDYSLNLPFYVSLLSTKLIQSHLLMREKQKVMRDGINTEDIKDT